MREQKNIWLGLLAIAFTLLAWLIAAGLTGLGIYGEFYTRGGLDNISDDSPEMVLTGLALIVLLALNLIGLILALVGLFSRGEQRLLHGLAIAMSVLLYLLLGVVLLVGLLGDA